MTDRAMASKAVFLVVVALAVMMCLLIVAYSGAASNVVATAEDLEAQPAPLQASARDSKEDIARAHTLMLRGRSHGPDDDDDVEDDDEDDEGGGDDTGDSGGGDDDDVAQLLMSSAMPVARTGAVGSLRGGTSVFFMRTGQLKPMHVCALESACAAVRRHNLEFGPASGKWAQVILLTDTPALKPPAGCRKDELRAVSLEHAREQALQGTPLARWYAK